MSDLDGLKYINDTFGHADGDRAIAAVADALTRACPKGSLAARFGGDVRFAFSLGDCDPDDIIRKIDEYLLEFNKSVELPYVVATSTGAYTTTLSAGYQVLKALKIADEKMYAVKNAKRASGDYITKR